MRIFIRLFLIVPVLIGFAATAFASEEDFYSRVQGKWSGNGEIIAGKFKNTRFNCVFDGNAINAATGIEIDGDCRIGLFSQPMKASVMRSESGYSGQFMDGAQGEGLDVVGGEFRQSGLVVDIQRKDLIGVMSARLLADDHMTITVSVRVGERLIPVIGMSLSRNGAATDTTVTGSID